MKEGSNTRRELNGYVVIHMPEHPTCMTSNNWKSWVYEHIYIAEKLIGRSLRDDECVHHLDLSKSNNAPANLIVLMKGQHRKLHMWLDRGAPGVERSSENPLNSGEPKDLDGNTKRKFYKADSIKPIRYCAHCSKPITNYANETYCSKECADTASRKVERPSKEELQKLVWELPTTKLAERYGVSDIAVSKWCKKYGIPKPPRGYWAKSKATVKQSS